MKQLTYLLRLAALWLLAITLARCSFLSPVPDKSRFFVLTPMAAGEAGSQPASQNTSGLVLGMGPVKFPDYLDRSDIVTRVEANRLQYAENDHWAEPLKADFIHVFSDNLSTLLGTQQIVNFPWYSTTHIDYQIAVSVDRFECDQGNAHLAARWTINDPVSGRILDRGESDLRAACGADMDQGVAGLSQTLANFSRQIATAVTQVSAMHRPNQG
ncbi:MAG TPA: PqiC family protein [Candidatus Binataceae bacterium]|jgi:uncharacterized lipoprotein YmbA|nr:PqiC family protein [Candidatus Binataceae bacterium]